MLKILISASTILGPANCSFGNQAADGSIYMFLNQIEERKKRLSAVHFIILNCNKSNRMAYRSFSIICFKKPAVPTKQLFIIYYLCIIAVFCLWLFIIMHCHTGRLFVNSVWNACSINMTFDKLISQDGNGSDNDLELWERWYLW